MRGDVAATNAEEVFVVQSITQEVGHEDGSTILTWPIVTEVNQSATVSVSTTRRIGAAMPDVLVSAPPRVVADVAGIVQMICNRLDIVVGVGVDVITALSLVAPALDHVIHVRDHAGSDEGVTVIIKVNTPWVTGPTRKRFKDVSCGVVTPHRCCQRDTF